MKLRLIVTALTLATAALAKPGWEEDFDKGLAAAKAAGKPALVDFTGSDWCPACQILDKEVFSTAAFKDHVKDRYVLIEVDYPQLKPLPPEVLKAKEALIARHNVRGFPTVMLLSPDGKELGRIVGYEGNGPEKYIAEIEKLAKK